MIKVWVKVLNDKDR